MTKQTAVSPSGKTVSPADKPNTKQRNQLIMKAAKRILEESGADVTKSVRILPLAKMLEEETGCHRTTAKIRIAQAIRLARGEMVSKGWGGHRKGAGRPPMQD